MKPPDAVVMGEAVIHYDEIVGAADDRTLEILERRRKTATVRRRGQSRSPAAGRHTHRSAFRAVSSRPAAKGARVHRENLAGPR